MTVYKNYLYYILKYKHFFMFKFLLLFLYFIFNLLFFYHSFSNLEFFDWTWKDIDPSNNYHDNYTTVDYKIEYFDNTSTWFIEKKYRVALLNSWFPFINIDTYWDFYINNKIYLIRNTDKDSFCDSNAWYSFSWNLVSEYWWDLMLQSNESYYCPETKNFSMTFKSPVVQDITLTNIGIWETLELENVNWDIKKISYTEIFHTNDISISWLLNKSKNIWNFDSEVTIGIEDSTNSYKNSKIDYNISSKSLNLSYIINKNILNLTKRLTPEKIKNQTLSNLENDMYFYDYEWQEADSSSNEDNKWVILELKKSNWKYNNTSWKIEVRGEKTLIVKWWNLYINSDIYNSDKNSILVIVVKRDETNIKNGWNIYINPWVTNIDAVLVSEWSILSYPDSNWKALNSYSNPDYLRKQLLIYGSLSTKNTIAKSFAPYWSDAYLSNGWEKIESDLYDLWNLRSFRIVRALDYNNTSYCSDNTKLSAIGTLGDLNTDNDLEYYAFAWKRKCYIDDTDNDYSLRKTEKVSGVVIEYNPILNLKPPKILKIH